MTKKSLITLFTAIGMLLSAMQSHAGTFTAFGQKSFVRGSGKPVVETAPFDIKNPNTSYTLHVYNGGANLEYPKVSSAIVKLNGSTIFDTNDFNKQVTTLQKQVSVSNTNQLQVELRSAPGSGLTIIIEGEDSDPPSVTITSPVDGSYLNTPSINTIGTSSDSISWVEKVTVNGTHATLTGEAYTSNIQLMEGPNVIAATATDVAGNTGNSTVSVILDTMLPVITLDPVPSLTNKPQLTITGKIEDEGPVTSLMINGKTIETIGQPPVLFNTELTLSEGLNAIVVKVTDKAGNIATASVTTTYISKLAPVITIQFPTNGTTIDYSPVQVRGTIDDPTATVTINGKPATISNCSNGPSDPWTPEPPRRGETCTGEYIFSGDVTLKEGENTITVAAENTAGQVSTASIPIYVRDTTPPSISILSPQNGAQTTVDMQYVMISVWDSYKFGNTAPVVTVNGLPATQRGIYYYSNVPLTNGANTITVTATDAAGNTASKSIMVYLRGPSINITSPSHLSTVATEKVTITGTVDSSAVDITASTYYSKYSVTLSGNTFTSSDIQLYEGANNMSVTVSDAAGNTRIESITVYLDTTPPTITITSPTNCSSVNTNTTTVTGTTNDSTAQITINGTAATITNNAFTATGITLTEGTNTINVTAKDSLENTRTSSVTIYLDTTAPTVSSTYPAFNETDVPLNSSITATFSEAMQSSIITSSTFTLSNNGTNISGSVTYSGSTATFTPAKNLSPETVYTATIKGGTSGVKDAAGNTQLQDYIWQFKTAPAMELTITEPQDGSIINKANAIIKGAIKAYTNDIGITVNGIIAELNGENWTAIVPLSIGQNTIEVTAKDGAGNTDTKSITVNTQTTDQPITISANPQSGIAPLNATFTIETSIGNLATNYRIDFEGDGVTDLETTDVSNMTHTYDTPGIYYLTVTATDSQGNTYTETTVINVLDRTQMDALLKAKWEGMKAALINGDTTTASAYIFDSQRSKYKEVFDSLKDQLPAIFSQTDDFVLVFVSDNRAEYENIVVEDGTAYSYPVIFVRDENGLWKIKQF